MGAFILGTLLITAGIAAAVGPVRLLAGIVAVPLLWAIVALAGGVGWIALRWHGTAP